jgi:hypothetical protein
VLAIQIAPSPSEARPDAGRRGSAGSRHGYRLHGRGDAAAAAARDIVFPDPQEEGKTNEPIKIHGLLPASFRTHFN